MKNPWTDLPDFNFEVGEDVFLPNSLPRGETHLAIIAGASGRVRAVFPDRGMLVINFGDPYGLQMVPMVSTRKLAPFTPGFYYRAKYAPGIGHEVRYFTTPPNGEWVKA